MNGPETSASAPQMIQDPPDWRRRMAAAMPPPLATSLLAVSYIAGAWLGFGFGLVGSNASLIWPPAGIMAAGLFLAGRRAWPGILVGAVAANLANGTALPGTAIIAAAAVVEALLVVELLHRLEVRRELDRPRDIPRFVAGACVVPSIVGATIGIAGLALGSTLLPADMIPAWASWWLGDALSILILGGVILTWSDRSAFRELAQRPLRMGFPLAIITAASVILFFDLLGLQSLGQSVAFPIVIAVNWVAFQAGPRGNALAAVIYSVVAVAATNSGVGPFVGTSRAGSLVYLAIFISLVAVSGAAVAAVVGERRAAAAALADAARSASDAVRRLEAVESIARLLAEKGATAAAFGSIVEALADVFGYSHTSIYTGNERMVRLRAQRGYTEPLHELSDKVGVIARAMRTRQLQFVPDVRAVPDFLRAAPGIRSEIAVPLLSRGALLGVLNIENTASLDARDVSGVSVAAESIAAALALATERERLAEAQRIAHIGDWEWDLATDTLRASDEMCRIAGFEPGGYPGSDEEFMRTVHPDDRVHQKEVERAALDGLAPYSVDFRIIRPDGEVRLTHEEAEVIRDADGRPVRVVGTSQDITEQRAADLERARLSAVVEQSPETIIITDTDALIQYVNPAFERTSGYRRDEALGENPRFLKSGLQPVSHFQEMWATLLAGRPWSGDFLNRRRDGEVAVEAAVVSPVRAADGKLTGYVAVMHDATRERELERQLQQSQRLEAVGQLAGGVAHDFNNLLTAIRGYTELLRMDLEAAGGVGKEDLAEIVAAADRAMLLTRQLLAFSRRQVLQPQVLDPAAVVASITPMLRRLIGEHITLVSRTEPGTGSVRIDPGQLEQVIVNLVLNARDAMDDGGTLTIETAALPRTESPESAPEGQVPADLGPGPHVRITVTDTGVGIDADTRRRMFEPFFTTKPTGRGTGLGLATVYGIVKQSGGAIDVESQPHRGTRISVYLPTAAEPQASAAAAAVDQPPGGTETILLAEDEPAVRDLAARILERLGYTVLAAGDGGAAMEIAGDGGRVIDLLVTDVVMPEMGGPELARRLAVTRPALPVLYVSGYAAGQLGGTDLPAGAGFLAKPFTAGDLGLAVRHALDSGRPPVAD